MSIDKQEAGDIADVTAALRHAAAVDRRDPSSAALPGSGPYRRISLRWSSSPELSFARNRRDVEDLLAALDELGERRLGVIVKIETAQSFQNLTEILLATMRRPRTGVMIARSDLAVECGCERLAELQEEILWLCEAAHLPVIWAPRSSTNSPNPGNPPAPRSPAPPRACAPRPSSSTMARTSSTPSPPSATSSAA